VTTFLVERFQILFSACITGPVRQLIFLERDGTVCLFRAKKARCKGTKLPSARLSPSVWLYVEASEFERVLTMVHLLGLWTLSVVWLKKKVPQASAVGPKGTREALLICI
jgi:hypothetical protein